jgi:ABC-type nitrate/sulfonate/bicarbonate transport system substrate-binding protein
MTIDRRAFIKYGAAGAVLAATAGHAVAQPLKKIRYMLAWVPEGTNLFSFVAKNKGFWKKRGLDVEIFRGYGSGAAVQALSVGQFDFVQAVTSAMVQQVAKGLPLVSIAQQGYKSTMGVCIPADSPIKMPKDLEGKVVGTIPTSGEYPFFPVFAKKAGVDMDKIKFVQTTPEVRYRLLMTKQFDAMTGFGSSAIPALVSRGFPIRMMLYANYGMDLYDLSLVAQRKTVEEHPDVCQAFVDGALEAMKFTYLNPEESVEIFQQEIKEANLTSSGPENARIGLGIQAYCGVADEIRDHGMGWVDRAKIVELSNLVMTYLVSKDTAPPDADKMFTNRFSGKIKLTPDEWRAAAKQRDQHAKYFS